MFCKRTSKALIDMDRLKFYFISFGIIEPILIILKIEYRLILARGYSVAYEETQSNRVSDFRKFVCSLFQKAILFLLLFYSTVAGVVLCGGRRLGAYAASQTTVLHMKRLNQTESPIFVILCVL